MVRVYTNHGKKSSTHTNHEGKNHPTPWFVYTRTMERKVQPIQSTKENYHPNPWFVCTRTMEREVQPIRSTKEKITRTHGSCTHEPWKESSTHTNHEGKLSPNPMVRVYTNHGKKVQPIRVMKENYHPTPWFVYTRTMERKFNPYDPRRKTITQPHGSCTHEPWNEKFNPYES